MTFEQATMLRLLLLSNEKKINYFLYVYIRLEATLFLSRDLFQEKTDFQGTPTQSIVQSTVADMVSVANLDDSLSFVKLRVCACGERNRKKYRRLLCNASSMRNCNYRLRLGRSQKQSIGVHASEA